MMAVIAAPARQALAIRGGSRGDLAGDQQENETLRFRLRISFPCCSFDGYYNLICADHVEATACSRFNSSWVSPQLFNFQT
jgi:hypothetical protein